MYMVSSHRRQLDKGCPPHSHVAARQGGEDFRHLLERALPLPLGRPPRHPDRNLFDSFQCNVIDDVIYWVTRQVDN